MMHYASFLNKIKLNIFLKTTVLAIFFLSMVGCSCKSPSERARLLNDWMIINGKLKVLSTTAMINDIVKRVGGDYVDGLSLIIGELDPHSYQLVKGDDEKLAFASLIFYNGLGLEHGPSLQGYLSKQPKAISLGNKIQSANPSLILDFKGQMDPHIWMDISLWAKTVPFIIEALSEKDPAHATNYQENGTQLIYEMLQAHNDLKDELHNVPPSKRYLVTSHDAFNYFAKAYLAVENETLNEWQVRFASPEGLAPDSQLSTTDIQSIIAYLKRYKVRILFPESNVSKDSIRKIVQAATENGINVQISNRYLYADAMGKPGTDADSYLKMMQYNSKNIAEFLQLNAGEF